jgi:hypothetical protein
MPKIKNNTMKFTNGSTTFGPDETKYIYIKMTII